MSSSVTVRCNQCGVSAELDGRAGVAFPHKPGCSQTETPFQLPSRKERRRLAANARREARARARAPKEPAACWRCSGTRTIPLAKDYGGPFELVPCPVCVDPTPIPELEAQTAEAAAADRKYGDDWPRELEDVRAARKRDGGTDGANG